MLKISVILCTYNRSHLLRQALQSLAGSIFEQPVEWEVLVVDNNSKDDTAKVADEFTRAHPRRFRYVFEPTPGRSYALNCGIRNVHGEILAFTDDDVLVAPDWLDRLTRPLRNGGYMGASGRTLPPSDFVPPRWLPLEENYALAPLALFDRGMEPMDLNEAPFGNNMAFRREAFAQHGVFRVDIGRCPGSILGSEDSEFAQRVLTAGERIRYEPLAVLHHAVPAERATQAYFLAWWHDKTRSDVRAFGLDCSRAWRVAGVPLPLLRRLLRWTAQWILTVDAAQRFACKMRVWIVRGGIRECYESTREVAQPAARVAARP
jgi:glucosyl-dolichyl phosphate glucuronosyltransferase